MEPSNINPGDLPDGFSTVDPNGPSQSNGGDQQKQHAVNEQKAMILEQACTQEALARLGRIKLVKPEKAAAVENSIVSMAMQGKLPGKISESKLIEILERGSMKLGGAAPASKINIQRKRYGFDSDDEDDNDDDLL